MQQNIPTKKQTKKEKKIKIYIGILILFFLIIDSIFVYKIFLVTKPPFVSPISKAGLSTSSTFEAKLKKTKIDFTDLKINGNDYRFNVKGEGIVIMTGTKNIDQQISSLQVILKNLKIKGIRFKSLDFRYDKPVIISL